MLFSELRVAVATMLNRTIASFDVTEGAVTINLIDKALRDAQLKAVQEYEFNAQKTQVSISITQSTGALISSAVLYGTATPANVKRLVNAFLPEDNYQRPTKIIDRQTMVNEQFRAFGTVNPYPVNTSGNPILEGTSDIPRVTIFGNRVFIYPMDTTNYTDPILVHFDAVVFPLEYHATTNNSDFLSIYGEGWIKWTAIEELNNVVKHYVPRQEGNVYNLDKKIAAEWAKLLRWDASQSYSDQGLDLD